MEIIRTQHRKTREELKQILISLLEHNGMDSSIIWNDFGFEGKSYGTKITGEIFEKEVYLEISGLLEKKAAKKLRGYWKELVTTGRV